MLRRIALVLAAVVACDGAPRQVLDGWTAFDLPRPTADGAVDGGSREAGGQRDSSGAPAVRFLAPADGATVANPVLFRIEARGVEQVEILADKTYSLGAPWDPSQRTTLLYRFSGTGVTRAIHLAGRVGGKDVVGDDITITVTPDPCEDRFFVAKFDANNKDPSGKLDLVGIREQSLAAVRSAVVALQACGAKVTLGAMLSLLYYEGAFRVAAYNTRCLENSYNKTTADCDLVAEALYSYQFGLGAIHTSNFHPCKGGQYTAGMRQRFLQEAAKAGFSTSSSLIPAGSPLATRFKQVCPQASPTAVDYYILGSHDLFGVPKNDAGNHLAGYGKFPLFDAGVSVSLTFAEITPSCAKIGSDRDAITLFGGSDASYGTMAKQDAILSTYQAYAAASCK